MDQSGRQASFAEAATTGPKLPWNPPLPGPFDKSPSPRIELPGYRDFVEIAYSNVSEVYRAIQDGVDRPVAVKVLLVDDEEAVARFQRELDITVALGRQHPHIVTVIDTGISSTGRPCIVMEFYDNGSLHDRLREQGPRPWAEVVAAGIAVADALAFAHRHGVLHRDIKPQNILVLPTSYVVADFGIARRIDSARTTSADWFSFRHAAPEVLNGESPSVADDIWSLGSTLYTLLDGRSPFAGDTAEEDTALRYMKRVRTSRPRPLPRDDVPPGLLAIIDRCLQSDPRDRFVDADSVLNALKDVAAERRGSAVGRGAREPSEPSVAPQVTGRPMAAPQPGTVVAAAQAAPPPVARPRAEPPPAFEAPEYEAPGLPDLAPSALLHLSRPAGGPGRFARDEVPTGWGPDIAEFSAAAPGQAPPTPSPLRRVAVVVAAGVLIGGLLAVGGVLANSLLRGTPGDDGTVLPAAPPVAVASPDPDATTYPVDAAIAPTITKLEVSGASAFLQWEDPSQGRAAFLVTRVFPDRGTNADGVGIGETQPGITEFLVEPLDPAEPPYCFLIIAVLGSERGVSPPRCVETLP